MSRTALAISPHLDDAAFSCGGTLATLADCGWDVAIVTVFTGSVPRPEGFALACQLDKGLGPDVDYMALRREEDRVACRALGVGDTVWMPFLEAPHRGYASATALFAGMISQDKVDEPISLALAQLIAERRPEVIFAPQAVGGHVDHIQVVRGLQSAAPRLPTLWWTDFPYSVRLDTPLRPFDESLQHLPSVEIMLSGSAMSRKRDACLAYRSQIGFQFGGPDGLDGRLARAGMGETFRIDGDMPTELLNASRRAAPAPHAGGSIATGQ